MKIILHGYNVCCQTESGGIQNRIRAIHSLLNQRKGVEAELFNPYESRIQECDILHLFKMKDEQDELINYTKELGKRVILSSVIPINNGKVLDKHRKFINRLPIHTIMKQRFEMLHKMDKIIAESYQESRFISKHYGIDEKKLLVIPNGVTVRNYTGREIYDLVGDIGKYAIVIGRFDDNKNQLNVIKALKGTGIHVVFLGGSAAWCLDYFGECIKYAGNDEHFHFLGWVEHDSDLFWSAISNADTMIFPSYNETFGLVALEAGIAGCKLAISETLPILDYSAFKDCQRFNPSSAESMRKCVLNVFNASRDNSLIEKIESEFSWDSVIDQHIELYRELLQ